MARAINPDGHPVPAMKVFSCDEFTYPLPVGHRFPVQKYALLRRRIVDSGLVPESGFETPDLATDAELLLVHGRDYISRVESGSLSAQEMRVIGLPWSPELVARCRRSVGGAISAGRAAAADGMAFCLSGGTHHAFRDHGQGFCIYNDVAVATRAMQGAGVARRVAIIDCDVHQGNGTASIFAQDTSVFTFSIHAARNFPARKERSDLDIELPDRTGDVSYLRALERGLRFVLRRASADLAYYVAGADPFEGDRLGRLSLTREGLALRDQMVLAHCRAAHLPVAVVMGGGYGRNIADTVEIHLQTLRVAVDISRCCDVPIVWYNGPHGS